MKTTNLFALAAISFGLAVLVIPPLTVDPDAVPAPVPVVHHGRADTHEEITAIPQSRAYPLPAVPASGLFTGP